MDIIDRKNGFRKKAGKAAAVSVAAAMLAGCGKSGGVVRMATKPMTEQYILSSMMKTLIEQDTDLEVEITEGVGGGTSNIQPAMEKGEFDFYPEYTGSGWNAVLKEESLYDESMFDRLRAGYDEMGMTWTGMLGFNNTYGLHFKDTMDLDIGLKYDAVSQKKIDAMNIFTTDGQLSAAGVKVLEDDKGLYPSYMCGFVVRDEALKEHQELQAVFDKVENLITDAQMAEMNYQVESEGREPEDVADSFLKENGLLK